jgi:hypothetical protein
MSAPGLAATLVALVTLASCGSAVREDTAVPATGPPSSEPTIVGFVTAVTPFEPVTGDCVEADPNAGPDSPVSSDDAPICSDRDTAPLGTVLVEEDPMAVSGDEKISFTISRESTLLIEQDGSTAPLSFADLADGMAVSAWADGPIAESYPAQATAAAILVRPS